jgi:hypothetical protein
MKKTIVIGVFLLIAAVLVGVTFIIRQGKSAVLNKDQDSLIQVIRRTSNSLHEQRKVTEKFSVQEKVLKSNLETEIKIRKQAEERVAKFVSRRYNQPQIDSALLARYKSSVATETTINDLEYCSKLDSLNNAYIEEIRQRDDLELEYLAHIESLNKSESLHLSLESSLKTKIWVDSVVFSGKLKDQKRKLFKKDLAIMGLAGLNVLQAIK